MITSIGLLLVGLICIFKANVFAHEDGALCTLMLGVLSTVLGIINIFVP